MLIWGREEWIFNPHPPAMKKHAHTQSKNESQLKSAFWCEFSWDFSGGWIANLYFDLEVEFFEVFWACGRGWADKVPLLPYEHWACSYFVRATNDQLQMFHIQRTINELLQRWEIRRDSVSTVVLLMKSRQKLSPSSPLRRRKFTELLSTTEAARGEEVLG